MKKRVLLTTLAILLALTSVGSVSALAAEVALPETSTQAGETILRADEFITYYRTYNGIHQYRIWNATRAVWVIPWTNC